VDTGFVDVEDSRTRVCIFYRFRLRLEKRKFPHLCRHSFLSYIEFA